MSRSTIFAAIAATLLAVAGFSPTAQARCQPFPQVSWWGQSSHAKEIGIVERRFGGNWTSYIARWEERLSRLQEIRAKGNTVVLGSRRIELRDRELDAFIDTVRRRLTVTRCLAVETSANDDVAVAGRAAADSVVQLAAKKKPRTTGNYKKGLRAALKQDFDTAKRIFTELAEQGHSGAQFNLGVMYHHGRGVKKNYEKAFELYTKAAAQEHPGAMNNLGRMHRAGVGVKKDLDAALRWFRKAAERHALGANNLAQMYLEGRGVEKDYEEAARLLRHAAEQQHAKSQYDLGILYANGKGVEQDDEEAIRLMGMATQQGFRKAERWLQALERRRIREQTRRQATKRTMGRTALITESDCPQVPEISWWGDVSHAAIGTFVYRKHASNWRPYISKWKRYLTLMKKYLEDGKEVQMQKTAVDLAKGEIKRQGAIRGKVVYLGGEDLARYITSLEQRIAVHACLAEEAETLETAATR